MKKTNITFPEICNRRHRLSHFLTVRYKYLHNKEERNIENDIKIYKSVTLPVNINLKGYLRDVFITYSSLLVQITLVWFCTSDTFVRLSDNRNNLLLNICLIVDKICSSYCFLVAVEFLRN
jgi:hypothetical protein